jgi:hypothetical protein
MILLRWPLDDAVFAGVPPPSDGHAGADVIAWDRIVGRIGVICMGTWPLGSACGAGLGATGRAVAACNIDPTQLDTASGLF